jgi:phosphomannomutase
MVRARDEGATFVCGYEEALGYTVGTVARDKDGVGAALVFADLAGWCRGRGVTVLDYLEEVQRRHGLFVAAQRSFAFPGAEGAQTIARIMAGFRDAPPSRVGDLAVEDTFDYQRGARGLPPSNVIAYQLAGGSRITLRPSGTEPKIKYYFELKETPAGGEPLAEARRRAETRSSALQEAFLALARERGQP